MEYAYKIEDMIDCFIKSEREDLVAILELLFEELVKVYEDDMTTDSEGEEEDDIEILIDGDGLLSLYWGREERLGLLCGALTRIDFNRQVD